MTRSSSQQAPASAPAQAKTEAAAAESAEAAKTPKTGEGEGGEKGARPEAQAAEVRSPAPQVAPDQASAATAPESEADPEASAAAQSRLPALVRTMTATAIGQPQQEAGPVGRPGKAALAGAAVVGALLVSVPFLVLAGNNDDGPERTKAAGAGTVLDGSGPEAPGEFAVTAPETSAPTEDGKGSGKMVRPEPKPR